MKNLRALSRITTILTVILLSALAISCGDSMDKSNGATQGSATPQTKCQPDSCQHNGVCYENKNNYICSCVDGYSGTNCEIPPETPCSNHPCQNGGSCSVNGASYSCSCSGNYFGKRCQFEKQPSSDKFKIKVEIPATSLKFHIGIDPTITTGYDFTVDCGDGTSTAKTSQGTPITCTYTTAGSYTISISGSYPALRFCDGATTSSGIDSNKLLEVIDWSNQKWKKMNNMFLGCSSLTSVGLTAPDLSETDSMISMFSEASRFNSPIGHWDVSHIKTMEGMFAYAFSFDQDLSSWDTSSVTEMQSMFHFAMDFNGDISTWNTSKVINMSNMFNNAVNFNQDISQWKTPIVKDMRNMFTNAVNFNQDISAWDTPQVKDMRNMFYIAINFNQDLSRWNTSLVSDCNDFALSTPAWTKPKPTFTACTP